MNQFMFDSLDNVSTEVQDMNEWTKGAVASNMKKMMIDNALILLSPFIG